MLLYNQILRPFLPYTALVWFDSAKTHVDRLEVFQARLLRFVAKAPWFVRNQDLSRDLGVVPFREHLLQVAAGTWQRVMLADNILLKDVIESDACCRRMRLLPSSPPRWRKRREPG